MDGRINKIKGDIADFVKSQINITLGTTESELKIGIAMSGGGKRAMFYGAGKQSRKLNSRGFRGANLLAVWLFYNTLLTLPFYFVVLHVGRRLLRANISIFYGFFSIILCAFVPKIIGTCSALYKLGIIDFSTWIGSTSGSSWFLSMWYGDNADDAALSDPGDLVKAKRVELTEVIFSAQTFLFSFLFFSGFLKTWLIIRFHSVYGG